MSKKLRHFPIRNSDKFYTTTRQPQINDIWLAKFPYREKGNMQKLRPILILDVDEENRRLYVQMFTTKYYLGEPVPESLNKYFDRKTYLGYNKAYITYDKLYRRIKSCQEK